MKEKAIEADLRSYCRKRGAHYFKLKFLVGFPDGTIFAPGGRVGFAEVKTPSGVVAPAQKKWLSFFRRLGFPAEIIRSGDEARRFVDFLTRE